MSTVVKFLLLGLENSVVDGLCLVPAPLLGDRTCEVPLGAACSPVAVTDGLARRGDYLKVEVLGVAEASLLGGNPGQAVEGRQGRWVVLAEDPAPPTEYLRKSILGFRPATLMR